MASSACPNASPAPGLPQLLPAGVQQHVEQQGAYWEAAIRGKLKPLMSPQVLESYLAQAAANMQRLLTPARPQLRIGGKEPLHQQEALRQILLSGRVQSQFETQHSGGAFNPVLRASLETELFGYPFNLDPVKRPVYGYLTPGDHEPQAVEGYGRLALRLRPEILSRTTVSIADTLDRAVLPAAYTCIPITSCIPNQSGWVYTHLLRMIHATHIAEVEFHYVEAQFHGGVRLQDVECIVAWSLADVPAELQRLCQQAGLSIREFGR